MSPDSLRDNVLVVSFGEDPQNDTNAYQALTELKQLDSQGQIEIAGAAVVTRDPDDHIDVKSEVANEPFAGHRRAKSAIGRPSACCSVAPTACSSDRCSTSTTSRRPSRSCARSRTRCTRPRTAVLAQVTEQSPEAIGRRDGAARRRRHATARRRSRAGDSGGAAQGRTRRPQGRRARQVRRAEVEVSLHCAELAPPLRHPGCERPRRCAVSSSGRSAGAFLLDRALRGRDDLEPLVGNRSPLSIESP